ncbi:hypothetical protein Tco_0596433 [Tanacetum coccineum]
MRTRSQTRNRPQQQVPPNIEPFNLEEPIENQAPPVVTMADQRTMAQLLQAPTEGYEDAIVVPAITADNFELKHGLLTLVQNKPFCGLDKEDPHAHIRYFNKITSTLKFPNVPNTSIKLMLFPFSLEGAARIWLEKEPPRSILLKSSVVTTAMTAILKQFQATPPPASVKAVEEMCVTCGGAHPYYQCLIADGNTFPEYRDNIQGYVAAATGNYNQGNSGYRPPDLPPYHDNPLSGNTTSSSPSLPISETSDYFLEEFADELAHFSFPPGTDYLPFDIKSDLREIEYFLNNDPIKEMDSILEDSVDKNSPDDNLVDTISKMFTDEHAFDYSSPPLWDDYDDEIFDLETVNDNTYDDPFDSKEEKIRV